MPRFSSVSLPFLVNQTQKQKHKLISSKNENTNTNPATNLPNQPNTKATNTNPATDDNKDEDVEKLLEPFTKDHLVALIKKGVSKHPDLIEIVRELTDADPSHRKIFIHGLGWDTTAETLTFVFGKYNEIEDCKAVTDHDSGKSKGYAFILFKQQSGAWKALKQPQKQIGNRTTPCSRPMATPISC
ncbi:hypothetical protein CMV_004182 [Castanea mollissima]|uniref:RRM domain-containing protein n=1 Tax=Castanea mollissima TaxID=60419 RepID=A0A8J4RG05_9ROSI|nr:hypothetical protein CMV_004182 [Castanea mollissima]